MSKKLGYSLQSEPDPALGGIGTVDLRDFRRAFEAAASTPDEWRAIAGIGVLASRKIMLAVAVRPAFASAGLSAIWSHSLNAATLSVT